MQFLLKKSPSRYIKFDLVEETVVTGITVTTMVDNVVQSFKVAANTRTSDPYDFSTDPQPLNLKFNVRLC